MIKMNETNDFLPMVLSAEGETLFIAGSLESAYWLLRGCIASWEMVEESLGHFYDNQA